MKTEKKLQIESLASFKTFRIGFYIYLFILNLIWLIICLPYSLFTWKWQYNAERFSVFIFESHFKAALKRKNDKINQDESKTFAFECKKRINPCDDLRN